MCAPEDGQTKSFDGNKLISSQTHPYEGYLRGYSGNARCDVIELRSLRWCREEAISGLEGLGGMAPPHPHITTTAFVCKNASLWRHWLLNYRIVATILPCVSRYVFTNKFPLIRRALM